MTNENETVVNEVETLVDATIEATVEDAPVVTTKPVAKKKKAAKKAVVVVEPAVVEKRSVGRPPVYQGILLQFVAAVMIAVNERYPGQGVSKTRAMLTKTGAIRYQCAKRFGIDLKGIADQVGLDNIPKSTISGVTLVKIGKELALQHKIMLRRGRPKKVACDQVA